MAARPDQLLQHIRRFASGPDQSSDGDLLARFTRLRDEDAFAALVKRHGPMVLAVCRRVLGDAHAAEDAFQATFLVLARKAAAVRHPEALAAWLHGVARHLAYKYRRAESRRCWHEAGGSRAAKVAPRQDPLDELTARELLLVLDEELQRLPEAYRLPLILCGLEGLTTEEAARRLGWSPSSVKGRLLRGRKRLHARLSRRGLMRPAALFALLPAGETVSATIPKELMRATVEAARAWHTRDSVTGISAEVATLVEGTLKSMAVPKLKVTLGLMLLVGAFAAGAGMLAQSQPAAQQIEPRAAAKATEPEKAKEQPPTDRYGDPLPPGAIARLGTLRLRHQEMVRSVVFSRDGKTALASDTQGNIVVWDVATGREVRHIQRDTASPSETLALSADGKTLACGGNGPGGKAHLYLWDIERSKLLSQHELGTRDGVHHLLFTPDGKTLIVGHFSNTIRVWDVASKKVTHELKGHTGMLADMVLSPDGKTLASGS
jgi:RNA polymerase sigma factor (sigma-70 family)